MHPHVKVLIEREYAAQKSQEWLDLRGNMLTASDCATAISLNHYETPFDLLLKKCGKGPVFTGNEATRHGEKYEDEARILYEQRHNEVVHEIGLCPHPKYTWLGGSPDGVSESGKLVEIKCPMSRDIGNGDVPVHYMPQLQMCMEILDLEEADFIQYKPAETNWPRPEEFTVVNVKRDREWWEKYFPVMEEFWQKVLYHREHGIEVPEPKVRKPRKKKVIPCEIVIDPEDTYISD
jgi:putative phage-type endonuclease|tara:strand:- start:11391 stop:12095 length:705 start_codon:yes stop_codon:yes gene_type:complete